MAEWNLPFAPPPQYAQEAAAPAREPAHLPKLICSQCQFPIEPGEDCMQFIPGKSGFGEKSGRPMVIESKSEDSFYEEATLHIECIYEYVFSGREPQYCAACDAQLDGDNYR